MGEDTIVNGDVKPEGQNPTNQQAPTGNATDNGDEKMVPKQRLDEEIAKKKALEQTISEIADTLTADVPEEYRDLIPALPPAEKITWLRSAGAKGLFKKQIESGPDSKRPGGQPPQDLSGLSPHELLKRGYNTTK